MTNAGGEGRRKNSSGNYFFVKCLFALQKDVKCSLREREVAALLCFFVKSITAMRREVYRLFFFAKKNSLYVLEGFALDFIIGVGSISAPCLFFCVFYLVDYCGYDINLVVAQAV